MFLQANRINHLVLTGISTSGVVLSTALEAADKDFQITVLEDAIGDRSKDKHDFIIEQILTFLRNRIRRIVEKSSINLQSI